MSNIIITAGSVTTAVRLRKKLNSSGDLNAAVIHTPSVINSGGCSYSVRTTFDKLMLVKKLAKDGKISYRKIYAEEYVKGESVLRDIS